MFGIGLNRPLNHDWLSFIAQINHAHAPVLAIDVPSGFNADTGEVFTAAIRATETLTVGAPKFGMLKDGATDYVGRLGAHYRAGAADWRLAPGSALAKRARYSRRSISSIL